MAGRLISVMRGDDIEDPVFAEMVRLMYASAQAIGFSIAMLMVAAIYCSVRTGDSVFIALTIAAGLAGALRIANSLVFLSRPRLGESRAALRAWQFRYAVGACLYSAAFGGLMFRSAMLGDGPTFAWCYGLGCGYAAGLVGYVAMRPSVARIQSLILMALGALGCLLTGDVMYQMMAVTLLLGWLAILNNIDVQYRGVREMLESRQALDRIARTDLLTGLWNRRHFEEKVGALVADANCNAMLLSIDLDHFKPINDSFGHEAGDEVLQEVARRLARLVPAGELMARTGGDEFSMLLTGATGGAAAVAEAVVATMAEPILVAKGTVRVGASVGIARVQAGDSYAAVARRADIALYAAKVAGRNTVRAFDPPVAAMVA